MISGALCFSFGGVPESGTVAPGTESPFGQDTSAAARTHIAEAAALPEPVIFSSAPRADEHTFSHRFSAVGAFQERVEHFCVFSVEGFTPECSPIGFLFSLRLIRLCPAIEFFLQSQRSSIVQSGRHLFSVLESFCGVNRECLFYKPGHRGAGFFSEAAGGIEGPPERPFG